jgi:hypothetical protein
MDHGATGLAAQDIIFGRNKGKGADGDSESTDRPALTEHCQHCDLNVTVGWIWLMLRCWPPGG